MNQVILLYIVTFLHYSFQHCSYIYKDRESFIVDQWWWTDRENTQRYVVRILCEEVVSEFFIDEQSVRPLNWHEALVISDSNITKLSFPSEFIRIVSSAGGIKMSNNFIKTIETNTFSSFIDLKELNLQRNSISSLPNLIFISNINLTIIDLSYNSLSFVGNTTFLTSNLTYLNLKHNKLQNLNFTLPASLIDLQLGFNRISFISDNFFFNLTALLTLSLENNNLKFLPIGCFKDLKQLQSLSLAQNKLKILKHGTFTGLSSIVTLNAANNFLRDTNGLMTHSLETIESLNIENNYITIFNNQELTSVLKRLTKIGISGNIFNCSYLRTIMTGFAQKNIKVYESHEYFTENIKGISCGKNKEIIDAPFDDDVQRNGDDDSVFKMTDYNNDQFASILTNILNRIDTYFVFVVFALIIVLITIVTVLISFIYVKYKLSRNNDYTRELVVDSQNNL